MSVLLGAGSDLHPQQTAVCPDSAVSGFLAGSGSPERDPLLNSLIEKQLTGACTCSSVPNASQAVTDGIAETEMLWSHES